MRARSRLRPVVVHSLLVLVPLLTLASASPATEQETLDVLSYNVHGLPGFAVEDNPRDRSPAIGWLANDYDVVAFQEDFEFSEHLARQMTRHESARGNGIGFDPRRLLPKLLIAPVALFVPNFWPPYGAGLTSYVREDWAVADGDRRVRYAECHGWFGAKNDCFSSKGFLRVTVRMPSGAEIHVYNTHLDAGSNPGDVAARRAQFIQLFTRMAEDSRDVAIILAGDLNTDFARPDDRAVLLEIAEKSDFQPTGAAGELPHWKDRDVIAFHDGPTTRLRVLEKGEDRRFMSGTRTLSDHPALFARFAVEPIEEGAP